MSTKKQPDGATAAVPGAGDPAAPTQTNAEPGAGDPAGAGKKTKARVLVTGIYGRCNDVVALDAETLKRAKADGAVDDHRAAVAYAESLRRQK